MGEKPYRKWHNNIAWMIFDSGDKCVFGCEDVATANKVLDALNSAHAAGRATAEAELAALRAKWEALRGECEAWRAADEECGFIVRNNRVMDSRALTDSTHAMEKP